MEANGDFGAVTRKVQPTPEPGANPQGSPADTEGNAIMDEVVLQDKPGIFSKIGNIFTRPVEDEDEDQPIVQVQSGAKAIVRPTHRYTVTIRRQVTSFEDA